MNLVKSPFNPSFGKVPEIFISRDELVNSVVQDLLDHVSSKQSTLIAGIRGTGKTAFIYDVSRIIKKHSNWFVVYLSAGLPDLLETLVSSIYQQADSKLRNFLNQIDGVTISVMGVEFGVSVKDSAKNYTVLLEEVLKRLQKKGYSLLVTIDEAQTTQEMRQLASVFQILMAQEYPIFLIMTGLPEKISELQNDDVLTFLMRSNKIVLQPLDKINVYSKYQEIFNSNFETDKDTLLYMTELVNGYAYAFQLLGDLVWNKADHKINKTVVDSILDEYQSKLFNNVYGKVYRGLSETDKNFVQVMAESSDKSVSTGQIAKKMGKSVKYISVYRQRLLNAQVIYQSSYGHVAFYLPFFKEFINEFGFML